MNDKQDNILVQTVTIHIYTTIEYSTFNVAHNVMLCVPLMSVTR